MPESFYPGAWSAIHERDWLYVKSIRPEGAEPIPVRAGTHRMGTIIVRFVAILALVIVVLMLVWYRS
jgi:cell division septal protein FtsQ